jgi:hypothetical protein
MKRRRTRLWALGLSTIGIALVSPNASLAGTLDQQQSRVDFPGLFVDAGQSGAQTFTAGLGGRLDQVDLYLALATAGAPPLRVEIRDVSGVAPGDTVLATQDLPPTHVSATGAFQSVIFDAPAPIVAGRSYAIVAYSAAAVFAGYVWGIGGTMEPFDPYPAGAFFGATTSPPAGSWVSPNPTEDLAFKTYVVVPAAAPTGQRAAALKKCKKKHSKKAKKKCKKKARLLPV